MEQLTDQALADYVRQGSRDAYAVLVDRHKKYVLTLIRCRVAEWETAEDLAQEVFIKLYRFLPGFKGDCQFTTWLYRLTLNTVRDYLRANRRQPATALLEAVRGWFGESRNQPEEQIILQEERETVAKVLRLLPDKYRDILYLCHYRQMTYAEIAALLDLPVKTVETRLYRAKKLLKHQWLEVNELAHESSERPNSGAIPNPHSGPG
ncbi:MAG: polymerase sigma70 factor [Paenibacillaceae bacterium]|jgi:RNA polymerase sigma-70 factor (ECF subfamily)|nr:polymerase sigma70 factor [Paenibacillaceae bacterium]